MRIEQLRAFMAVVETGSFQNAAKECGITQSTISRQIQSLESLVGLSLFHRSSPAKLTIAGEILLNHARRICSDWQEALSKIKELSQGKQTELCIAAIHSVCSYYLPPVLQAFFQIYPQVQLRVTSLGSDRALKVLRDGLIDLAIVMNNRFLTAGVDIVIDHLYNEPIKVLMSANHPLKKYQPIPWSEIVKYPQILFKDGYGMQRLVQEQFQKRGATLNKTLELNTLDAFRGIVRQGEAIALLPAGALLEAKDDSSLAVRDTDDTSLFREVVLVTTSDRLLLPPIQQFRSLVHQMIAVEAIKV